MSNGQKKPNVFSKWMKWLYGESGGDGGDFEAVGEGNVKYVILVLWGMSLLSSALFCTLEIFALLVLTWVFYGVGFLFVVVPLIINLFDN
jgi:hypothetical protein